MKILCFIFIILLFCSCNQQSRFKPARFDSLINKPKPHPDTLSSSQMEQLNQGKNVFDPAKEEISALVELCINSKEREGFFCMDDFHCYAYYENSDTLKIDVSNFKMYSGYGFEIRYIKGRYYIQPYFETHNNLNDPRDDRVEMVDQNLILNKVKYKVGDSLYGKIYFHGNVMDFENSTQFGQGYFRAKVYDLGKFQDSIKAKYY